MKKYLLDGEEISLDEFTQKEGKLSFKLDGEIFEFEVIDRADSRLVIQGKERFHAFVGTKNSDGEAMVLASGAEAIISEAMKRSKKKALTKGSLTSPMPGKIFKIIKEEGTEVKEGETILILEAMKMEHSIRADKAGKVKKIFFKPGELVQGGVTLAEVE